MRRRRDKVDEAQRAIVEQLRKVPGLSVEVGHDDILVGAVAKGVRTTFWYEIKSDRGVSRKTGKIKESAITNDQRRLDRTWVGHRRYVSSFEEIVQEIRECKLEWETND